MFTAKKWTVLLVLLVIFSLVAGCAPKTKETVKLAFFGPLTGGNAAMGLGARNSFLLAVKQRNENPETKYHYEVVVMDDECKPDVGVQAALSACSDPQIVAAASTYCSIVALATADTFHNCGLPAMVWASVHPDVTYGNDYVEITRVNGTMIDGNKVHAQWLWDEGFRKVSVLHDTTDYGRGHLQYFTENWEALGGEILSVDGLVSDQTDFTAELTRIKALEPEVVVFLGLTPMGVAVKRQFDKLEMEAQYNVCSGCMNESFNEALGESAEGVVTWLDGAPYFLMPGGQDFLDAYEEEGYEERPEAYGPFAYVAANLIIDTIEQVGPDRKQVAETVARSKRDDTLIGPVEFDDHGQNIIPLVTIYVSQDGEWVVWEDSEYATGQRTLPGLEYMEEKK
jgi:branched-chain amino acid transport system substrate-binding protein